jgi:hypothetical protein
MIVTFCTDMCLYLFGRRGRVVSEEVLVTQTIGDS